MASFEEEFKAATTPGPNRQVPGAVLIAADKTGTLYLVIHIHTR
jgi:hypothetical protein